MPKIHTAKEIKDDIESLKKLKVATDDYQQRFEDEVLLLKEKYPGCESWLNQGKPRKIINSLKTVTKASMDQRETIFKSIKNILKSMWFELD